MRIGLFGGSFNPPHIGHQIIAETVCELAELDEVWWIPASVPPHRTWKPVALGEHRLKMTRMAIDGNPRFRISTVELDRKGPSYTVDTVRHLVEAFPDNEFKLIVGGDSLSAFSTWRDPAAIIRQTPLLVYPRTGAEIEGIPAFILESTTLLDVPKIGISSSHIRHRLHCGQSVRYLIPETVAAYIDKYQLYNETDVTS